MKKQYNLGKNWSVWSIGPRKRRRCRSSAGGFGRRLGKHLGLLNPCWGFLSLPPGERVWPTSPFYPKPLVSLSQSRQVGIHEVSSPCSGRLVLQGLALGALTGAPTMGFLLGSHIPRGCWEQDRERTAGGGRILPGASRDVVPPSYPGGCSNPSGKSPVTWPRRNPHHLSDVQVFPEALRVFFIIHDTENLRRVSSHPCTAGIGNKVGMQLLIAPWGTPLAAETAQVRQCQNKAPSKPCPKNEHISLTKGLGLLSSALPSTWQR